MIQGIHGLFYSNKAEELRAFIRDKLALPFTDVHDGWLIFDFKEGDLGVHPTEDDAHTGTHDISFFTDDVHGTVAEMKGRGVVFDDEITDRGYGQVIHFTMPGGVRVQLYQPRYVKKRPPAEKPAKRPAAKRKPAAKKPAKKAAARTTKASKAAPKKAAPKTKAKPKPKPKKKK
jgi:outer membrane biosynthesis protein TonB